MKLIICDNCGEKGNECRVGELCDICNEKYLERRQVLDAEESLHTYEVKKEFHIRD